VLFPGMLVPLSLGHTIAAAGPEIAISLSAVDCAAQVSGELAAGLIATTFLPQNAVAVSAQHGDDAGESRRGDPQPICRRPGTAGGTCRQQLASFTTNEIRDADQREPAALRPNDNNGFSVHPSCSTSSAWNSRTKKQGACHLQPWSPDTFLRVRD
jgi:hypothetical protein